jgi:predicted TIM-barrel fold metal-dependent hydrolase
MGGASNGPAGKPQRTVSAQRIDVHHHFFPSSMDKAKRSLQLGWRTPPENLPWSPEISLRYMDASGIDFAILSLPPSFAGKVGPEDRAAARAHNSYAANVCKRHPTRFGFFAGVPFLDDVEGGVRDKIMILVPC